MEEDVLPAKLKLRDEIRDHHKVNKKFQTLVKNVDDRKQTILEQEQAIIEQRLRAHEKKLSDASDHSYEISKVLLSSTHGLSSRYEQEDQKRFNQSFMRGVLSGFIARLQINLSAAAKIEEQTNFTQVTIQKVHQTLSSLLHSADTESHGSTSPTKRKIAQWKLSLLKASGSPLVFQSLTKDLQILTNTKQKTNRKLTQKAVEVNAEFEESKKVFEAEPIQNLKEISDKTEKHLETQVCILQEIFKLNSYSSETQEQLIECDKEIFSLTMTAGLDNNFVETLKTFDAFVGRNTQFAVDYLGPVFIYLKKDCPIAIKFELEVASIANVILFLRGSTARKVHRSLVASKVDIGAYTLLGIDEFVAQKSKIPEGFTEDFISADVLVDDTPFKKVVRKILRDILLIETVDDSENAVCGAKLVTYESNSATVSSQGSSKFKRFRQSDQKLNFINEIQEVFSKIQTRTNLIKTIENIEAKTQLNLKKIKQMETSYRSSISSCQKNFFHNHNTLLSLLEERNSIQKRIAQNSALMQAFKQLIEECKNGVEEWNEQELLEELNGENQELLKAEIDRKRDITMLENQLMLLQGQMKTFWLTLGLSFDSDKIQEWVETSLEKCEENDLAMANALGVIFQNAKSRADFLENVSLLTELEFETYKLNSEKSKVDGAFAVCEPDLNIVVDMALLQESQGRSKDFMVPILAELRKELREKKRTISLEVVTNQHYGQLVEAIKKAQAYADSPVEAIARNRISSKAFPLMNLCIVKQLKDTVSNFKTCFNTVMSSFIRKSMLFFYTRGVFDEIKHDDFSWESFDICRLKAMDFVVEWKKGKKDLVGLASLQKVKGLLLIMHIINYMSIFKFIIIDEGVLLEVS